MSKIKLTKNGEDFTLVINDSKVHLIYSLSKELLIELKSEITKALKKPKEESKKQIWKEEYSSIDWKDFKENYFQCSRCGTYDNQQCICYAR